MTTLVLLRHAKAEAHRADDHSRSLAARGRADAAVAGERLRSLGITSAVVSTSTRTRETYAALGLALEPAYDDRVYDATLEELLEVVDGLTGTVLLVGHNPGIEQLAFHLDDGTGDLAVRDRMASGFPTSAFAVIDDGVLVDFQVPRG